MFDFGKKRREKKQRILFQEMQKSKAVKSMKKD